LRFAEHPAGIEQTVAAALGMATPATENPTHMDGAQARTGSGPERVVFAFHKRGDLGRRVYRLNDATRELIGLCDGSRSIGQIDAALAERGIDATARIRETIDRLVHDGVLRLQ
jgi:hypothetical protein